MSRLFAGLLCLSLLTACPSEDIEQEDTGNGGGGDTGVVLDLGVPPGDGGVDDLGGSVDSGPAMDDVGFPDAEPVACDEDNDCTPPLECTLEGICAPPICQNDQDCTLGLVCRGGECVAPPSPLDAVDCNVLTDRTTLRSGERRGLYGIARNANGLPLVGLDFEWTSSDPRAVFIDGQEMVGGRIPGLVTITARVLGNIGVMCNGQSLVVNLPLKTPGTTRIALISNDTGGPILSAPVFLETMTASGAVMRTTNTSTLGEAVFAGEDVIISITAAQHPNFDPMAVLAPGSTDVLLVVRRAHQRTVQGGLRGLVSGPGLRDRDVHQAIVGSTLRPELSDFGLRKMLCNQVETDVDAPALNIQDTIDIPGNTLFGAGDAIATDDSMERMIRCPDGGPNADQLGCYVLPSERGHNAPWVLAGSFALADVAPFASLANEPDFFCGGTTLVPLGFPWVFRTMQHGVNLRSDVFGEITKINRPGQVGKCTNPELAGYDALCQPDYARFNRSDLIVRESLSILSRVSVPGLPLRSVTEGCLSGTLMIAGVELPERGLVPLGFAAGVDEDAQGVSDCVAALPEGIDPFGPNGVELTPGILPLWMAPRHSGLEDQTTLTLAALSFGGSGTRLSLAARFKRVTTIGDDTVFDGGYLPLPFAELDMTAGRLTMLAPASGNYVQLELVRPAKSAVIFAPANMDIIELPAVPDLRETLGPDAVATVQIGQTSASYDALFTFGGGTTLNRWIEQLEALSVEECRAVASGCIVR